MIATSDTFARGVATYQHAQDTKRRKETTRRALSTCSRGTSGKAMAAVSPMTSLGIRPPMRAMWKNSEQQSQAMAVTMAAVGMLPAKRQASMVMA